MPVLLERSVLLTLLKRSVLDNMSFLKAQGVPLIKMVYQKHTKYCPVVARTFANDSWPYDDTPESQQKAGDLALRQLEIHLILNLRPHQQKESYGEVKKEVHTMVQKLAEAKVQRAGTLPGRRSLLFKSREAQPAEEVTFVRRRLSFTAVQQHARLLLDRLQLLGEGAGEAARRREWA